MWHAQACMLLRALPLDVVRVICAHVDECDADFPMPATDRTIIGPDKRVLLYKRKRQGPRGLGGAVQPVSAAQLPRSMGVQYVIN